MRYDVFGRGKAPRFFEVDRESGVVKVKDDLRKEINSEYEVHYDSPLHGKLGDKTINA